MNVRKKPSLDAPILYTRAAGTEVRVLGIVNDWLHLTDGTFILYGTGKFARTLDRLPRSLCVLLLPDTALYVGNAR